MEKTRKILLLAIICSMLLASALVSCLEDGNDTIIVEKPQKTIDPESEAQNNNELKGENGKLRVNLQWDTKDDLDLYVKTPCGDTIYFYQPEYECNGHVGKLDIDANFDVFPEHPQENIYWKEPGLGEYQIYVVNNSDKEKVDDINFTITVILYDERTDLKDQTHEHEIKLVHKITVK